MIPAYNASSSIEKCLVSIYLISGSGLAFEVIVIDDCSTDNTLGILEHYATTHPNLLIRAQKRNQRQGAARNVGIDLATGEYIAFVDADDTIVVEGVLNAFKAVKISNADICYFDFEYEMPRDTWHVFPVPSRIRNSILTSADYLNNYYTTSFNGPCRNLFRHSLLRNTGIRFCEGVRWEDCDWTVKVYSRAETIQFVSGVGYRYSFSECSSSRQQTSTALAERLYAGLRLIEFSKEVQSQLPGLSETLYEEGRDVYVKDSIRFRRLTKYSAKSIIALYKRLGRERCRRLLKFQWSFWESFFLKNHLLSFLILSSAYPFAAAGRWIIRSLRVQ